MEQEVITSGIDAQAASTEEALSTGIAIGLAAIIHSEPGERHQFSAPAMSMVPLSADSDARTINCTWYAGASMPRIDWNTGEEYDLQLDLAGCRLDRLNAGAPVLDAHMAYEGMAAQIGAVRKAWKGDGGMMATLQFSANESVTPIWNNVSTGIFQNLSPGVWIYAKRDITPDKQVRRVVLATDWEPFEISLVPVPADAGTMFMSAESQGPPPAEVVAVNLAGASAQKEIPDMAETIQDTGAEARINEQQLAAARVEGTNAERLRVSAIRTMVAPFKQLDEKFTASLIDTGKTVEVAREEIMAALAAKANETATNGPTGAVVVDQADKRREAMQAAILFRGNPSDRDLEKAGREYAGLTLLEMARECLDAAGVKVRGMSRNEIARVALQGHRGAAEYFGGMATTSDFPNILANVANKTLRQAYEFAPRTFTPFCRQVSASDFKPVNRIQLSEIAALHKVNEKGEFHRTYLSDSKESYSLATYGDVVSITRQVVVNDDLQALTRIPAGLGMAAATLESDTVWGVITGNPNMADAVALFHATHKNLNATNGLAAVANITTARAAMRKQTGPKGTILNLIPKYLIVPAALEGIAVQLTNPINLAATASSADVPAFVRAMVPIVEPRLDAVASVGATNWFLSADAGSIDTIEYCYLEGQQGVYIETRQGFDVDGVEIKARLDFAAAAIDFRGLAKNTA